LLATVLGAIDPSTGYFWFGTVFSARSTVLMVRHSRLPAKVSLCN